MANEEMACAIGIIDKRESLYSFRLPEVTKKMLDKLPSALKKELNDSLLFACAQIIHKSRFDPRLYLTTDDVE